MDNIGRRGVLQFLLAAGVTAAAGAVVSRAEAASLTASKASPASGAAPTGSGAAHAAEITEAVESAVEPTQVVVVRPGRVVVGPRRRRRVCWRRRGRTVCEWR